VTVQARLTAPASESETAQHDVARVLAEDDSGPADPAIDFDSTRQAAMCAPLYSYADQTSPLRPEAAVGEPSVTKDGTRYTFRVRQGLRFSPPSNHPVTAAAYARSIERALHPRMGSYIASALQDVKSVKASGNTLVIALERPAGDLTARLSATPLCPVPPDTPIRSEGIDPVPSAGPYYAVSHEQGRTLVLRRNPNYGGSRPQELREISYQFGVSPERAIEDVVAGRADYFQVDPLVSEGASSEAIIELTKRFGPTSEAARAGAQLVFQEPAMSEHYFAFNSTHGPFASADLRRAVNYAIDRRRLATNTGVGELGRPTDQYLPPGLPGFVDIAAYPLGEPDPTTARRLADGFRGSAVLYTCSLPECVRHAEILRTNLKAIGIELDTRRFPIGELFGRIADPSEPFDIALANWFADYADPANFTQVFGPNGLLDALSDSPELDRRLAAAAPLTGDARLAAYAKIDRYLVEDLALAAPFASGIATHVISARMGCEVFRPIYAIELGALCVSE
jgi:peptide/nickel transport system substrate-binding protein